jgi:spore germination protein YaaH
LHESENLTVNPNLLQAKPQVAGGPNATVATDECFVAIKDPYRPKRLTASVCPWLFILMLAFGVQSVSAQTVWSEGYWFPGITTTSTITQWSAMTHIGMVGGDPNTAGNGTLTLESNLSTDAPTLISAAHSHGIKVLFTVSDIGGADVGWLGSTTSTYLSTFITNIMTQVNTYGFDGAELDWEGPTFSATQAGNMVSAMRTALGSKLLVIDNTNVGDGACNTGGTYTSASVAMADRVYIETYDQNGVWEPETSFSDPINVPSGSGLQSISGHMTAAAACGYPAAKITIGIAFYGYLATPNTGPYQTWGASPVLTQYGYAPGLAMFGYSGSTFDSYAELPWRACTSGNPCGSITSDAWLQWENPQSVTDKINYVYANNLGGWAMWVIGWDYTSSASPQMPLLDAVGKAFTSQVQPPTSLQVISVN